MRFLKIITAAPAKWKKRTKEERIFLLEAFLFLGVARLLVLIAPFRFLSRTIGKHMAESASSADSHTARTANLVGQAVRTAAANTPWQSVCLPQAMAGQWMLKRRNIPGTLYLGVKKSPESPEKLAAHAWLRCGGLILTGADGHRQFTVVSTFATKKRAD
jgi:hypothetical protein